MIHFFPTFSRDAANSPYGEGLRRLGIPFRIIAGDVPFTYRSRLRLVLVCIPNLALFAVRAAVQSLLLSRPRPDIVVLGSDIEVAVFAVVRAVSFRRTRIVLGSFIFTRRGKPFVDFVRLALFRVILAATDSVVVHSRLEMAEYSRLFPGVRFVFVPWGGSIGGRKTLLEQQGTGAPAYILAAGKSGRDYATLFRAMQGIDVELRVVCDYAAALPPVPPGCRITILADCHGGDYLKQLASASIVVIPLAVDDISAGQMVLIQAMGLARRRRDQTPLTAAAPCHSCTPRQLPRRYRKQFRAVAIVLQSLIGICEIAGYPIHSRRPRRFRFGMRVMRQLAPAALALALCATASDAHAVPLLSISGSGDAPLALLEDDAAAAAFMLTTAQSNLSFTISATCFGCSAVAWLTSALDVGFDSGTNLISASALSAGPMFAGTSLGAGTYFLVVSNTSGALIWDSSSVPTVTSAGGLSASAEFTTLDAEAIAPGSRFTFRSVGTLHYTVDQADVVTPTPTPEPASAALLAAGLLALAARRRA